MAKISQLRNFYFLSNGNLDVVTKLVEINAHFEAYLQTAKIEVVVPNFKFPSKELSPDARKSWDRFIQRYEYAVKVNELSISLPYTP